MSRELLRELYERFFVINKCGGCSQILAFEDRYDVLCPECALAFRVSKTESCQRCHQSVSECRCMPKILERRGALCLRKLFFYKPQKYKAPQNRMLLSLKRFPNRPLAGFVAEELWEAVKRELSVIDATEENTVIVGVPRGIPSRRAYGYDQSELVGRELSRVSKIPYAVAIGRRWGGRVQKRLDRKMRLENVRSLFKVADAEAVKGRYVILLDDVVTTGASMTACTELLKKSGAFGVFCLSMAVTVENSVK